MLWVSKYKLWLVFIVIGLVKIDLGVFRCSNPRLLISGLIASSVLINLILSMSFMKNRHLWDYVLKIVISINWRF
jgi:hypothetical protein